MKKIIILTLTLALASCAYGPTQEKKSSLNYLNGEHYEQSASFFGAPIVERKTKNTIISGRVQMDDPFAKLPENVEVSLINNGKVISTILTSHIGNFEFQGLFENGDYTIKAIAPHFAGEKIRKVDSYKMDDVLVVMYKLP